MSTTTTAAAMHEASDFFLVAGTANQLHYPAGAGLNTTTAASSCLLGRSRGAIADSFEVLASDGASCTLSIYAHDGTTVVWTGTLTASLATPFPYPLGGPNGCGGLPEGWAGLSAKRSNTAWTVRVNFR